MERKTQQRQAIIVQVRCHDRHLLSVRVNSHLYIFVAEVDNSTSAEHTDRSC